MIKVIVVDDEQPSLNKLVKLLENNGLTDIIGKFTKPLRALEFLKENKVDAVFLDIEMPDMDGIELASHILDIHEDTPIVFVTAYNKYAVDAFRLNALDYLMKPITADRLKKSLDRMRKSKEKPLNNEGIYIRCFGRFGVSNGTEAVKFRTEKAEELLAYIIDKRGRFISRSEILDTLWPNFDGDRALTNFNVTLHYLKKALIQYGIHISFIYDRGGYTFDMRGMNCDYLLFSEAVENNKAPCHESIIKFEETAELFTGEYLSGWEYDWAAVKRIALAAQYISLILQLAGYYKEMGDFKKAGKWLNAGLLKEPLHREINYRQMEILILMNEHALAAKHYDFYKNGLKRKHRQEPDEEIQKLFQ